ncbi:MAG: polysaccharide biosynthesis/export family protein [Amaricoccus sp.]
MQGWRFARGPFARALLLVAALASCSALPRSGPSAGSIKGGSRDTELGMHVVDVTPAVAAASRSSEALGFDSNFVNAPVLSPDTIRPGDTLSVQVWENVDTGLLVGVGQKATELQALQVDQKGNIFVPYAGEIHAAGQSPDQLRATITQSLSGQTPDPQVEVRRVAGDGATVSVMGGVKAPGVFPIQAPTLRLSSMLAMAGGVVLVPDVAQIKIERNGRTGRIWLQDLYDKPSYDIALRGGDRIIVEEDRRSFTALGATLGQSRVPFNKRNMTAMEAIATVHGLDGRAANASGVFIFRDEPAEVANRVLGRSDLVGPQRMAYLLDLAGPEGIFAARDFVIRDEDTIFMTEAALGSWTRIVAAASAAAVLVRTVNLTTQ